MIWLRIQANIATHAKFVDAGPVASWLWLAGLGHCRLHLTDGFIKKAIVPTLVPELKGPFKHAAKLVAVNLWQDAMGGYTVKDYLTWNPSKEVVEELRRSDVERKRRGRVESERIPAGIRTPRGRAGAISPSLSDSAVEGLPEESAKETDEASDISPTPPVFNPHGVTRRESPLLPASHRNCFDSMGPACLRGVCIPRFLGDQWRAQIGGEAIDADQEIFRFIKAELAQAPSGPLGDGLKFWRDAWTAKHRPSAPLVPRPGRSVTEQNLRGLRSDLRDLEPKS